MSECQAIGANTRKRNEVGVLPILVRHTSRNSNTDFEIYSAKGMHVCHTIFNGAIEDKNGEDQRIGKKMSADAVGKTYFFLADQKPELWTHEWDMRPAAEKFENLV